MYMYEDQGGKWRLNIEDRIILYVKSTDIINNVLNKYHDHITSSTLVVNIVSEPLPDMYTKDVVINGEAATIGILPANTYY
jgi:hypothetical protein